MLSEIVASFERDRGMTYASKRFSAHGSVEAMEVDLLANRDEQRTERGEQVLEVPHLFVASSLRVVMFVHLCVNGRIRVILETVQAKGHDLSSVGQIRRDSERGRQTKALTFWCTLSLRGL